MIVMLPSEAASFLLFFRIPLKIVTVLAQIPTIAPKDQEADLFRGSLTQHASKYVLIFLLFVLKLRRPSRRFFSKQFAYFFLGANVLQRVFFI